MDNGDIVNCVFMDKLYGVRNGDVITTVDAYWMEDELVINSFYIGEDEYFKYNAFRIVEMKLEGAPNTRIPAPISGTVVGRMVLDNFRNITMFTIEV